MRFITEFELLTKFEIENYKTLRARGAAEWVGLDIAKAFGYQLKGETTLHGPVSERHTLEIEAFPMDKWVEFKTSLLSYLAIQGSFNSGVHVLEMIKALESHGKPVKPSQDNEQS